MSENDRKFKVEFTLGKVKSWKMSQKKSENFRGKPCSLLPIFIDPSILLSYN